MKKGFGSDNHSGIHPIMLQAIVDCNLAHEPSYGTDPYSLQTAERFREIFGTNVDVHFVFNGTAANVLSLRASMNNFQTALCSDVSHLNVDEGGAPEFFAGKLQTIPSAQGKIRAAQVEKYIIRKGDQHFSQVRVLSLTQPTELGTCYSLTELRELVSVAKKNKLYVHVDGARIANAVFYLGTSFREMITDMGVDIVSFGGTKNGFAFGEAVVILNEELKADFKYLRKQSAQLPSKTRFIAHQFYRYLQDDNYLKIAGHSIRMAQILHDKLNELTQQFPGISITQPQQSNAIFITIPKQMVKTLREHSFFYVWDEAKTECRLMTSWDTSLLEIQDFVELFKRLLHQNL